MKQLLEASHICTHNIGWKAVLQHALELVHGRRHLSVSKSAGCLMEATKRRLNASKAVLHHVANYLLTRYAGYIMEATKRRVVRECLANFNQALATCD